MTLLGNILYSQFLVQALHNTNWDNQCSEPQGLPKRPLKFCNYFTREAQNIWKFIAAKGLSDTGLVQNR